MNVYEVEFRAVITLAAQDMQKAALHGTRVIRDSPHLIYVKAVYEKNFKPTGEFGKDPYAQAQELASHWQQASGPRSAVILSVI